MSSQNGIATDSPPQPERSLIRRIVDFPLARFVLAILFVGVGIAVSQVLLSTLGGTWEGFPLLRIIANLAGMIIVGCSYWLYVRLIERRPVQELALRPALRELGAGTLVGALLFTLTIGILWLLGYYQVTGTNGPSVLKQALIIGIVSGFTEEILFRAILYRICEEALGTWLALLISAIFFGFAHGFNPGATIFSSVAIALEAGLMLAAMYSLTRRLWLSVGTHFAWNFTQGGIFGVAVSGNTVSGLLQSQLHGPELLSGGAFGAEASVIALLVCLAAFGFILMRIEQQGKRVAPMWRR